MIRIDIPGRGLIELTDAVFDVNGTIAVDGVLIAGVAERLQRLSRASNYPYLDGWHAWQYPGT